MDHHHPWQLFPGQLIRYALEHLHRSSEFDQIVGFLLLDVGVETILKVFLLLPEEVTHTDMTYPARRAAAEGNFHDLVRGVERAAASAGNRLAGINLGHIEYFHGLRNKLYHAGNGISVQGAHAEQYGDLALKLLRRLLGTECSGTVQEETDRQETVRALEDELAQTKELLRTEVDALDRCARLAIEGIEPRFLMPSLEVKIESWGTDGTANAVAADPGYVDQTELLDTGSDLPDGYDRFHFGDGDLRGERYRRTEILKLMPPAVRDFVEDLRVETAAAAQLLLSPDLEEFRLTAVCIGLDLSVERALRAYRRARIALGAPLPFLETDQTLEEDLDLAITDARSLKDDIRAIRLSIERLDRDASPRPFIPPRTASGKPAE